MFERAREDDQWEEVPASLVEAELEAGIALFKAGKLEAACARFVVATTHSRFLMERLTSKEDLRLEARAVANCATACHKLGRVEDAVFLYRLSCWIFEKMQDRQMVRGYALACRSVRWVSFLCVSHPRCA
jgi:hypothetical protein